LQDKANAHTDCFAFHANISIVKAELYDSNDNGGGRKCDGVVHREEHARLVEKIVAVFTGSMSNSKVPNA
jgi:hypothetical protein